MIWFKEWNLSDDYIAVVMIFNQQGGLNPQHGSWKINNAIAVDDSVTLFTPHHPHYTSLYVLDGWEFTGGRRVH